MQVTLETSGSSVWTPFNCPKKKASNGSQLPVWELNLLLLVHNLSWANGEITKQNALRRFFPFLLLEFMAYKSPQASLYQVWWLGQKFQIVELHHPALGVPFDLLVRKLWMWKLGPTWEFEMMVLQTAPLIIPPNHQWEKTQGNGLTKHTLCLIFPQGVSRIHFW